ncbi:MAG: 4-alpha-glucanotransferase, partial [Myxococcales bacterium]|nr:4-alpha-glucanotransferase [Myxococcales bacterium]
MAITQPDRNPRRCGVLLHPTSLPGPHGIGDLGAECHRFIEWMASADVRTWQVLPLVPPGAGNSPYSSWSAFAANPMLIDLRQLARDGLLSEADVAGVVGRPERVDWAAAFAFKPPRLAKAAQALLAGHPLKAELDAWRAAEASWVEDAALFGALRVATGFTPWWTWPAALRKHQPKAVAKARAEHQAAVDEQVALQFLFHRQWAQVRAACAAQDIQILGDLPIYVDADSADVWANQGLFQLDKDGQRKQVAGVPPDAFSETGQLWGNPLYAWDAMAKDGYRWWIARMQRAMALHDQVRIDHFRAFSAYWAVPADAEDARAGAWVDGPGVAVFDALRAALGDLPIVAEDLGVVDDGVIALLQAADLPGMKVLQFAFGATSDNLYLPHNHPVRSVVYPGTHDNNTTLGWWQTADEHVKHHVRVYYSVSGDDIVWDLIKSAIASPAELAVIAAQDLLNLDGDARMNTPAIPEGNWGWRLAHVPLPDHVTGRLRFLVQLYGRGAE